MRLLIVEDEAIVRMGLVAALSTDTRIEVCGTSASGLEAIEMIKVLNPDVILLDLSLSGITGLGVLKKIKQEIKASTNQVIVFATHASEIVASLALDSGANSYLLKRNEPSIIIEAIIQTYELGRWIDPKLNKTVFQNLPCKRRNLTKTKGKIFGNVLTPAEQIALNLVACGLSNVQIALTLYIDKTTVKSRLHTLFQKLQVTSRAQAIAQGLAFGYITSIDFAAVEPDPKDTRSLNEPSKQSRTKLSKTTSSEQVNFWNKLA
ncbi:response regulator [Nostoc sp. MG11]|uniref:response regulator n=1 Tax=Nostoc sp. MG11 TaxID=2721166 RepID=UPI001866D76C|nr:response regulator transcription factor [Nostoc sp. MG11]